MDVFALITKRLILRHFTLDDAVVALELLNEPSFKNAIGDRGVRTLTDARAYLQKGPLDSYLTHGYGVYLTMDKEDKTPVGMCGLFKRENLEQPDLGFAFFARACGKGYGREAAEAVINYAKDALRLPLLSAVTSSANSRSIGVIEKLGFVYKHPYCLPDDDREMNYYELGLNCDENGAAVT